MKNIIRFFILLSLFSGCSTSRYLLTDKGKDKRFLVTTIKESIKTGEVKKKPIIVIDGKPYRYDFELKNDRLQISKRDIENIEILKNNVGIRIYGEFAKDGVLIVTTKIYNNNDPKSLNNSNVLILLENKEINKSEMEKIKPDDISSIDVIKDKEKIKLFTSKDYDGVIIIHLKDKK